MATGDPLPLEQLIEAVTKSGKYRFVSRDVVARIGARQLAAGRPLKQAVKATKNKLHQIAGAYRQGRPDYAAWLEQLARPLEAGDKTGFRAACRRIMDGHASTRERLPILDEFYAVTLGGLPPIHSVLDLACGLNPLAVPWMPLAADATYTACDIYTDLAAFLNDFFLLAGVRGRAQVCDLATTVPPRRADLALALKILPPLEQLERGASRRLLAGVRADYVLVSFPARSLGGRDRRMPQNYRSRFQSLVRGEGWGVQRFEFATELAFLICKTG